MTTATKAQHTPGPWRQAKGTGPLGLSYQVHDVAGHLVAKTFHPREDRIADANARLIAASPLLLEALREAERVIRHAAQEAAGRVKSEIVGGWLYHADKTRAAIAAAEGR